MSERERWIVYPLLFLALGASLRDKLAKKSVTDHVICQQLSVLDERGVPVAQFKGGRLQVERVDAQQVNATNLRSLQARQGNAVLSLFLEMLRRTGGGALPGAAAPGPAPPGILAPPGGEPPSTNRP